MKTISETFEWCIGVAARYGDPAMRVAPVYARFVQERPVPKERRGVLSKHLSGEAAIDHDEILATWEDGKLWISLADEWLDLPIDPNGAQFDLGTGELKAFGMTEITRGLWALTPSLNIPNTFHFFVHVFDVPESAPWERRIITVSQFAGGRL